CTARGAISRDTRAGARSPRPLRRPAIRAAARLPGALPLPGRGRLVPAAAPHRGVQRAHHAAPALAAGRAVEHPLRQLRPAGASPVAATATPAATKDGSPEPQPRQIRAPGPGFAREAHRALRGGHRLRRAAYAAAPRMAGQSLASAPAAEITANQLAKRFHLRCELGGELATELWVHGG